VAAEAAAAAGGRLFALVNECTGGARDHFGGVVSSGEGAVVEVAVAAAGARDVLTHSDADADRAAPTATIKVTNVRSWVCLCMHW
jgi:hypothetical protein